MNAKERFSATRRAVYRLHDVKLMIMNECDDWKPEGVKASHEVSDPTASRAIYTVDELSEKLAALKYEESELESLISESLAIIEGVKAGFGEIYAYLLEARYIDLLKWTHITSDTGIAKSTGHYLLDVTFDWIDSVGVSRLLKGDTEI